MLRFTDAFVLDPARVASDVTLQAQLSGELSVGQIVELTLILGAFLGFSKLRIALGLVPREMDVRVVPTPIRPGNPTEELL